jgi:hypothetical protein
VNSSFSIGNYSLDGYPVVAAATLDRTMTRYGDILRLVYFPISASPELIGLFAAVSGV